MNIIFILIITVLTILLLQMCYAVAQLDLKLKTANKSVKSLTVKVKKQQLFLQLAIDLLNTPDTDKQAEIMEQHTIEQEFKRITSKF